MADQKLTNRKGDFPSGAWGFLWLVFFAGLCFSYIEFHNGRTGGWKLFTLSSFSLAGRSQAGGCRGGHGNKSLSD
ncbi:hypothetical protein [Pedosphaera parvula]|uniref:Uncharacterized protein n=1 Tax=Pedosphaera parvula (strain Ellin514) TaxID=320771 RepID=B9XGT2_PEDPL|nr:hypothetical protein [Pedosphaera parvula]EEF60853.1 hypothetical protein Cflav_PD4022 [Pedosphaera parvula Ellin514]